MNFTLDTLFKAGEIAQERVWMKGLPLTVHRRDLLRIATVLTGAAAAKVPTAIAAQPLGNANRRRARYQADSAEVRNFYRVNRYPGK